MTTYYKVLNADGTPCHGGTGRWHLPTGHRPGKWMPRLANIEPCHRGYHVCKGTTDLLQWLGEAIFVVEIRGVKIRGDDKIVASEARLVRRCGHWNEHTARLFAAACARDVLPIFEKARPNDDRPRKAIEAAEAFARGEVDRVSLDAAWDAAWAAGATAWDAAWDAAGATAWAAAGAAAWAAAAWAAAAWATAGAAARAAAGAAARAAARAKQARRLAHLLRTGTVRP